MAILQRDFYNCRVTDAAARLLGKTFVRIDNGNRLSGKIVEVEAYEGLTDQASHSYSGKTRRNAVMFGPPGVLYVYFTYGMHCCCNVVTGPEGAGDAVLIRAVEPIEGSSIMETYRNSASGAGKKISFRNLASGPAKMCQSFNIGLKDNGTDLLGTDIFIEDGPELPGAMITAGKRIGIKKSAELPWRFYIKDSLYVSHFNKNKYKS